MARKETDYQVSQIFSCSLCGTSVPSASSKCPKEKESEGEKHEIAAMENRDVGKLFHIREMPSKKAQEWSIKLFAALVNAGFQVSDEMMRGGMAAVFAVGFSSVKKLRAEDAIALIDELMGCITICRDPRNPELRLPLMDDDIEEVGTRFLLAAEVFKLHTGFLKAVAR